MFKFSFKCFPVLKKSRLLSSLHPRSLELNWIPFYYLRVHGLETRYITQVKPKLVFTGMMLDTHQRIYLNHLLVYGGAEQETLGLNYDLVSSCRGIGNYIASPAQDDFYPNCSPLYLSRLEALEYFVMKIYALERQRAASYLYDQTKSYVHPRLSQCSSIEFHQIDIPIYRCEMLNLWINGVTGKRYAPKQSNTVKNDNYHYNRKKQTSILDIEKLPSHPKDLDLCYEKTLKQVQFKPFFCATMCFGHIGSTLSRFKNAMVIQILREKKDNRTRYFMNFDKRYLYFFFGILVAMFLWSLLV